MKSKAFTAVLLTALFLVPIWTGAAGEDAFTLDLTRVLPGMNRSWLQGYEPSVSQDRLTLLLPILSSQASGPIETALIVADEAHSPFKPQTMSVRTQPSEDGVYAVRLPLSLYADRTNGDYACVLRISGSTESGEALVTELPYTLRIRDGQPNREPLRMQITDVLTDLKVGEDGWVRMTLTNPCRTVTFEQPVLRLSDERCEILPQGADVVYLDDLSPGGQQTVTFPMTVTPGATVSHHSLQLSLSWQALGQTVTQTECHTVSVTQEPRLEQGGLRMADSVVAGDSLTLTLPLMNLGRAELTNVLASVSLPGITEKQSVLVGTIAPGETRNAQLTLTPGRHLSGDFTGTLTVEATDALGSPTALTLPVALTVEPPPVTAALDAPAPAEEPSYLTGGLLAGCALLLVLCVAQGVVLRRRIRRLEEERL